MRTLWVFDLGSWRITGRKWRTVKVSYSEFCKLEQWLNNDFGKWIWPGKMCIWIRHVLQTDTLEVFSEENTGVQSIWLDQSWIRRYDIPNKGSNKSANTDTSKKLEIPFGIAFENWSNGFVKSWNLKHNKFLMSTIQYNRNFYISVNWSEVITRQIGVPRNVCKV